MIVCTDCGHRNDDGDDFCGSCGAFLEFSGERTAGEEVAVEPEPEVDEDHRPTIVERVKAAVGMAEDEGSGATDVAGGAAPTSAPAGLPGSPAVPRMTQVAVDADEAAEIRRRSEEEAQRRADDAQRAADEASRAAEEARRAAEDEASRAAEAEAREAKEREAREQAERAVAEAQEQARQATESAEAAAAERAAAEAERQAREDTEQAEQAKRQAAERAAREAAEAEAAQRAAAEARETAEREAREKAEAARRRAEEQAKAAETARREAEARAQEAEQAARMAALVAKAKPAEADVTPVEPSVPDSSAGEAEGDQVAGAAARKPEAVKPQKQKIKRAKRATAPEEVLNPGDLVCGQCGAGNDPDRRFCRRCGTSLVAAAVVPKLPWYRRIFRRKPKAKAEAGSRPDQAGPKGPGLKSKGQYAVLKTKSTLGKVGRIGALLALVGVAGLSLGPWRGAVGDQLGKLKRLVSPEYEAVRPASATASSEAGGHPAAAAIDQIKNSYWAEGAAGTGEGQGLTFTFAEPVDLDRVGFLNGASENPEDFVTQPRPREVQLLFDDGTTETITLKDEADFQEHGISAGDVTTVQLQVISVYPSLEGDAASLAEVEFFTKK